jgi:hypothetical protein
LYGELNVPEAVAPLIGKLPDNEIRVGNRVIELTLSEAGQNEAPQQTTRCSRMCCTHRRVYFKDLQDYKSTIEENRTKALDQLAAEGQELDMGY